MIFALAAIILAISTAPALADPTGGIITGLVFNALISNSVTFALAGSAFAINAISAAVSAGLYLGASSLLSNRRRDIRRPDQAKETIRIPDAPMLVVLGRAPVSGSLLFGSSVRQAGLNNLYRHVAVCSGPIDAVEEYYISKRLVTVEPDGVVSSPPYAYVGGSYAKILTRDGEDTETAFSQLVSAFPSLYTSAHRGDNLAQMLSIYTAPATSTYLKIFPNGKPEAGLLIRGEREVYDPRTGNYAWTDNGPLCVLHFMLMPAWKGWGTSASIWDMADIANTADAADQTVALDEGGTEKVSRCGGIYSCDRPRGEILADLLLSTGTRIVRLQNGKYSIRLEEDNPDEEIVIPERVVSEFEWAAGPESVERPNRFTVKCFPAQQDYNVTQLDLDGLRWGVEQDEIDLVGERLNEIVLNFCQWHGQASRIARRLWYLRRAQRGQIVTNLYGMGAMGRTVARIPFVGLDRDIRVVMVQPRLEDDGVTVSIPFNEFPSIPVYDPAQDQAPVPDTLPDSAVTAALEKPDAPTDSMIVTKLDASKQLRVAYTLPTTGETTIAEAVYRVVSAGGAFLGMTERGDLDGDQVAVAVANPAGETCEFKVRIFNANGEGSYFSDVLSEIPANDSVAAPDDPVISLENVGNLVTITVEQSPSIQATYVNITGPSAPGVVSLDPFQTTSFGPVNVTAGSTETWYATAYNSTGVASGTVSDSYSAPAP